MSVEQSISRSVLELTSGIPTRDYVTLMRWLSDWALSQASAAEYTLEEYESTDE